MQHAEGSKHVLKHFQNHSNGSNGPEVCPRRMFDLIVQSLPMKKVILTTTCMMLLVQQQTDSCLQTLLQ